MTSSKVERAMKNCESKIGRPRRDMDAFDISYNIKTRSTIKEWSEWSLTPHTEDEIREKCLTDFNNVCFTYLCGTSKMSEEFIEELLVLSTGYLTKNDYNKYKDSIKTMVLVNIGILDYDKHKKLMENDFLIKNRIILSPKEISEISDRVDWYAIISTQKLSEEFISKYKKFFTFKDITTHQRISPKFKEELKQFFSIDGKKQKTSKYS